jgi:hypothetical protein
MRAFMRKTYRGVMMKRAMHRGISILAATILTLAASVVAFTPAAFAQEQPPAASRSQTEPQSTQ